MKNISAIQKIDKMLSYHFHFTDWEFGGGNDRTGEKCPRPEKIEWLVELFKLKMNRLKDFLNDTSNLPDLERFIKMELTSIDSKLFLKKEYELFVGKYGEIPYFILNCNGPGYFYFMRFDNLFLCEAENNTCVSIRGDKFTIF